MVRLIFPRRPRVGNREGSWITGDRFLEKDPQNLGEWKVE